MTSRLFSMERSSQDKALDQVTRRTMVALDLLMLMEQELSMISQRRLNLSRLSLMQI